MKNRGEITVFLSLCILCVAALLCVMAESVRTAGSRYYFQTAVGGALDSLFSRYHRKLWQQYRVLGLPCESQQTAADLLQTCTEKYLEVENWYPMELESIEITEWTSLAGRGGDYLAQEILDYMKFGIWGNLEISPDDGGQFLKDISEAAGAGRMTDVYEAQAGEVQKLEKTVEKIVGCVSRQEEYAARIADELAADDADGFWDSAAAFRKEAGRMEGFVEDYKKQADKLAQKLADTRETMTEIRENWQEDRAELFEKQMNPYSTYVDADGSRRQEILAQLTAGKENLERLDRTEVLVEEAETAWEKAKEAAEKAEESAREAAENAAGQAEESAREAAENAAGQTEGSAQGTAGPMEGSAKKEAGRTEGSVEKTAARLAEESPPELSLAAAAECWNGYVRSGLKLEYTERDTEKQGLLEQVKALVQGSLLELVLPADAQVSSGVIVAGTVSSNSAAGTSAQKRGPVERVLIHEYCGHYFTNALSEEKKQFQYEMEYLLQGKSSDRENLQDTMTRLLVLRQGLNLIHILSDPAKRDEARGLAAGIVGVTGLAPLVEVMACFVMCVWAMAEAVMDLRTLYAGGRVPLWKRGEDWKLSLEGLLDMGREKTCPDQADGGKGYTYETYLKLMLFLTDQQDLQLRMLDMMDLNLKRQEEDFSVGKCVYRVGITGKASGKYVFFRLPFVEKFVGETAGYPLEAPAQRAY